MSTKVRLIILVITSKGSPFLVVDFWFFLLIGKKGLLTVPRLQMNRKNIHLMKHISSLGARSTWCIYIVSYNYFWRFLLPISCRFRCRRTKSSLTTFRLPIVYQNKRHKDRSTIKNGSQKHEKQSFNDFTITPTKYTSVGMCQSSRNFPFCTQERLTFLLRTHIIRSNVYPITSL